MQKNQNHFCGMLILLMVASDVFIKTTCKYNLTKDYTYKNIFINFLAKQFHNVLSMKMVRRKFVIVNYSEKKLLDLMWDKGINLVLVLVSVIDGL